MYTVHDTHITGTIAALPPGAIRAYLELRAALESAPWGFPPISDDNPDAELRHATVGPDGALWVYFVIIEHSREVTVVEMVWLG